MLLIPSVAVVNIVSQAVYRIANVNYKTIIDFFLHLVFLGFPMRGSFHGVAIEYKTRTGTIKTLTNRVNEREYKLLAEV